MSLAAVAGPIAGQVIGGFLDQSANNSQKHENRQANAQNIKSQKEFAQNGIRWKVEDAKRAGISPLAALGAQTTSFSPVSVGGSADHSMGDMARGMGQDISRAISSTRTADEQKMASLQLANAQADLDGRLIENQIKNSQLQKMNAVGNGPPMPSAMDSQGQVIPGQGNSVNVKASEIYASQRGAPGIQSGAINSVQYAKTADGKITVVPSTDMKERIEDDFIGENMWHLKNRIMPPPPNPRDFPLPKGATHWKWNPWVQEFEPAGNKKTWYDDYSDGMTMHGWIGR